MLDMLVIYMNMHLNQQHMQMMKKDFGKNIHFEKYQWTLETEKDVKKQKLLAFSFLV